jgi:CIC family chloride channel protein
VSLLLPAISIGTGGSVGPEGPIVSAGAGLGSLLGQWLELPPHAVRTLVGCGAAGGIAGIFNAPIAGVLFAGEVILGHFAMGTLVPIVIAAAVAAATGRWLAGGNPAFEAPAYKVLSSWGMLIHVVIGVVGGLFSAYFIRAVATAENLFQSRFGDRWVLRAVVGGALLTATGLLIPEVLAGGYRTVEQAVGSTLAHAVPWLLAVAALKVLATAVTLASGGTGGVFAPSLVIGSTLGAAFGVLGRDVLHLPIAPPGAFALVGMAAIIAGSMRSPVGAMMIVFEMTGDYALILPLMVASTLSTYIASKLEPESIYTGKLARLGEKFRPAVDPEILARIEVREVLEPAVTLAAGAKLAEIEARLRETRAPVVAVVDAAGRLEGLIRPVDIEAALAAGPGLAEVLVAADVVTHEAYTTGLDEDVAIVSAELALSDVGAVPVVDREGLLLGIVRHRGLMARYREEVLGPKSES